MEHEHILEKTLPDLSYHIVKYIMKYNTGDRFLENIPSHYDLIVESFN